MRLNVYTSSLWMLTMFMFGFHLLISHRKANEAAPCKEDEGSSFPCVMEAKSTRQNILQDRTRDRRSTNQTTWLLNEEMVKLKAVNKKLNAEIVAMKRKERQLKLLARRLAAIRKGDLHYVLPKLDPKLPWVFAVTPTYSRFTQKADLVRLSQTLMHVTNIHWIIIEDSAYRTDLVSRLLTETGLSFTHLHMRTPIDMQRKRGETRRKHHRGIAQRNIALKWIRDNVDPAKTPGCLYFMDDDNTYHIKIFDEMRFTRHVSAWPVGLAGGARWQGPVVSKGKIVRFHTNWAPERSFPMDMAGFAVSLELLIKKRPNAMFNSTVQKGYMEPSFLEQLTTINELEPMAENCTKVYVWHTRTEVPLAALRGERQLIKAGRPSDVTIET